MNDRILKYITDIEEEQMDEYNIREFTNLLEKHEQVWKPAKEELETINMGNEESQRELRIETLITYKEREDLITLLKDYIDVWSYENMLELDTDNVVYKVPLEKGCKQIKQKKKTI